ncbi:MAG: hypothetical protein EBR30_03875 [Cytophagia bacterium]|nr:hypothetical protein [Cytophagia bacterium]
MAQSGAGAEVTALAESLQAYACAARQLLGKPLTSITDVNEKTVKGFSDCDRPLNRCLKELDGDWFHSVIVTANKIFDDFDIGRSDKYIFYRGGSLVSQIYSEFSLFTLIDYNNYIFHEFFDRNLVGISLKKVPKGPATSKIFNEGEPLVANWNGYKLGAVMGDSKDIYMRYTSGGKEGEIQLRNFSSRPVTSSWQGEIKGKTAAGGKIGGGIVMQAAIEAGVPKNKLMMPNEFNSQIQKPSDKTLKDFVKMFKSLSGSKKSDKDLLVELKENIARDKTWWMSKYLGVHYVYTIMDQKKQEEVVKYIYQYASSATKNSSIFIKYS